MIRKGSLNFLLNHYAVKKRIKFGYMLLELIVVHYYVRRSELESEE